MSITKGKRSVPLTIAMSAMMAAMVTVTTYIFQIPVPQTEGYINVGDAMVFTVGLVFGPVIGGFAGGIGSAISDLAGGYSYFAPVTLVVKGLEGTIAGLVSNGKNFWRDVTAVSIGGIIMISGYFLAEAFLMGFGVAVASVEIPGNLFQVVFGGVVSIPISATVRKFIPALNRA